MPWWGWILIWAGGLGIFVAQNLIDRSGRAAIDEDEIEELAAIAEELRRLYLDTCIDVSTRGKIGDCLQRLVAVSRKIG